METSAPAYQPPLSRWSRLGMFGLLYLVQGAALAYFRNFQKPYLDGFNISADTIGLLTTILLLPFIFKIFIGMLSDRVNLFKAGHRKPYIITGLLLATAAFSGAAFVLPDISFLLFSALIVTGSFSIALFDSTTDGLAIDITPHNEQGTVQGVMVGGRAVGFIVLSLAFGWLVGSTGYRVVFLIIAACMLLPLIFVLQVKEPPFRPEQATFHWSAFGSLGKPRFLLFALYAIAYSIVSFGIDGLITFFMSDRFAASNTLIGTFGSLRGIGAVIGALLGGLLLDRIGRRPGAYLALAAVSLGGALVGLATGIPMLLALGIGWGIAWGFQETIFVALAMHLCDSRIAASMFAIMMAVSNIGTAIGDGGATALSDNWGFSTVFITLALLNVINIPILWGLFRIAPELTTSPQPAGNE